MAEWIQNAKLMLTARCRDATHILSEEQESKLSPLQWWTSRLHLLSCGACRQYVNQMKLVEQILAEMPEEVRQKLLDQESQDGLSEDAILRIRQALEEAIDG